LVLVVHADVAVVLERPGRLLLVKRRRLVDGNIVNDYVHGKGAYKSVILVGADSSHASARDGENRRERPFAGGHRQPAVHSFAADVGQGNLVAGYSAIAVLVHFFEPRFSFDVRQFFLAR